MRSLIFRLAWVQVRELGLNILLFSAALVVRLPNLLLVPRYGDEGLEVLWSLPIAQGTNFPLTGYDAYYGPIFPYLMAALIKLFGKSILLPALTVAIVGALTVVLTYWVGRSMWNPRAALFAAALTLTSPTLIIFSSHPGESNSLTPFFVLLTLGALWVGVTQHKGWLVVAAGLLAGLTIQTHPLSMIALVGMLWWFLARRDLGSWLRRRESYLAVGLGLLAYAPMIVANLRPDSPMFVQGAQRNYVFAPTLALDEYVRRVVGMLQHIGLMLGGGVQVSVVPFWGVLLILDTALIAGLILAWWRNNGLLAAVFISSLVFIPIIVKVFDGGGGDRYIAYLAPVGALAVGGCLDAALRTIATIQRQRVQLSRPLYAGSVVASSLALVALFLYPLTTLSAYYDHAFATGTTNVEFYRLIALLNENHACGPELFIHDVHPNDNSKLEAYFTSVSIHYLLMLDGCGHNFYDPAKTLTRLTEPGSEGWLVAPEPSQALYAQAFDLKAIAVIKPYENADPGPFVLYHIKRHSSQPIGNRVTQPGLPDRLSIGQIANTP